jgi:hypothetical protein
VNVYVCPMCGADLDGGEIPEESRHQYAPPFRFSRIIAIIDFEKDRTIAYRCPDYLEEWPSQ